MTMTMTKEVDVLNMKWLKDNDCEFIKSQLDVYFPDSLLIVKANSDLYDCIRITFYLGKEKSEWAYGYPENDITSISFFIERKNGQYICEAGNRSFVTKPSNQYMAYDRINIPFRKTTGDLNKICLSLQKFFQALRCELIRQYQENNIHNNHISLVESKVIKFIKG